MAVTNVKLTEQESILHPSSNLPKGCKPLKVRVQRMNKTAHIKENTKQEVVPIQNKNTYRSVKTMETRNSTNKVQQNAALQEQCENNLFKAVSEIPLQVSKAIKMGRTKVKFTEHESILHPSSNLPKGCKRLKVKVQRMNKTAHIKENTKQEVVQIQNTNNYRSEKTMKTKNSINKGIGVNTSNSCENNANLLNVNKKNNGLWLSNNQIFKGNIRIENVVLTPEHRNSLNKLSLSKCSNDWTIIDHNSTKNHEDSLFSPVKNSTKYDVDESPLTDGKSSPDLLDSSSKEGRVPRNVTNNSDLIEQLICSNEDSQVELDQNVNGTPHSVPKGKRVLRNVTDNPDVLEQLICCNKDSEVVYDQHEVEMPHSNSKGEMILRNVIINPDLIEQLICSNEESKVEHDRNGGASSHFISKGENVLKNIINNPNPEEEPDTTRLKPKENNNTTNKFFQRLPKRKLRSGKAVAEAENIFEFLSQSDTSESEVAKNQDPAADIIKKLISEGKVRVETNQKGTGRPILKRGRRTRRSRETDKKKVSKEKENKKIINVNKKLPKKVEIFDNCDGGASLHAPSNLLIRNEDVSMVHNNQQHNFLSNDIPRSDEQIRDEGFSRLARSVLLQETRKVGNIYKSNVSEQRRLLEVARKFVSTPAANQQMTSSTTADISPIKFLSPQNRPVCPSPWRINDDSHLPSVFNFSKNKSYLPTFSSDYIPSTPKKNKANDSEKCIDTNITMHEISSNVSRNSASSISNGELQFFENDSNVENMPPKTLTEPNTVDNEAICNLRQLPNPRHTFGKRSPLKTINILEVVSLPPWKKTNDEVNKKGDATAESIAKHDKPNDRDLFGFEEFLDEGSDDDGEISKTNIKLPNRASIKRNLHCKLKDIQKWRPKNSNQSNTFVSQKSCEVFEYNFPKQQLINEMLCSTMVNMKSDKQKEQINFENCNEVSMSNNEEDNVQPFETDFFNDYEPETTFDKKKTPRTYARPAKRKRKARKNFVMFQESEESNSDSEEEQQQQRKNGHKKRRHEALDNAKENSEIDAFVNKFNSMCKDVENYELLVE